jgi:hypothetical protein
VSRAPGRHGCSQAQSERLTPGDGAGGGRSVGQEMLVTAQRQTDAVAHGERGEGAAGCHPYILADHMSAVTENGIVRL